MTIISEQKKSQEDVEETRSESASPSRADLQLGLELHFFAHLNLAEDANRQLASLDMGRTHHRILYFTVRTPGITVGEMTSLLRVTHQNVQRAMGDLLREGYIEQQMSNVDRRQRRLFSTSKGLELFEQLSQRQFERLARAYSEAGPAAVQGFWAVLTALVEPSDLQWMRRGEEAREAALCETKTDI